MKNATLLFLLVSTLSLPLGAQVAFGLEADLNFYQWNRKPDTHSHRVSGQAMQFITIGPKIWIGDWLERTVSLEGKVDFAPFSFNRNEPNGVGALSFPILAKYNQDISYGLTAFKIGIGGGVQWTRIGLYEQPPSLQGTPNPFFMMYIGEISAQFIFDSDTWGDGGGFEVFVRSGGGKGGSATLNFGVRTHVRWGD